MDKSFPKCPVERHVKTISSRRTGLAGKTSLDSGELEGIVDAMEAGWCP